MLGADPAVLQRRYDDAVHGQRRHAGARRRDAARDPERAGTSTPTSRSRRSSTCASGATSAASTSSRRRRRTSTSRPASRRRSTAASCPGAPASASATTSRWRCPTTRAPTTSPSAPSGRTRATCCASPTAARGSTIIADTLDLGQPAPPRRRVRRAGTRTHVALAVELGADHQLRRATPSWRARRR